MVDKVLAELEDQRGRLILVIDDLYELRSLLTAIRTGLEVGLAHPDHAPRPGIARRAARQPERLERPIAQLLVLAKADTQQLAGRGQQADLAALLTDLGAAASAQGSSIDLSVPRARPPPGTPRTYRGCSITCWTTPSCTPATAC